MPSCAAHATSLWVRLLLLLIWIMLLYDTLISSRP
jgi:hypothetical protein